MIMVVQRCASTITRPGLSAVKCPTKLYSPPPRPTTLLGKVNGSPATYGSHSLPTLTQVPTHSQQEHKLGRLSRSDVLSYPLISLIYRMRAGGPSIISSGTIIGRCTQIRPSGTPFPFTFVPM